MLNLGFGIALLSCLCPGMAFSQSSGEVQRLYAQYQSLYVQGRFAEAVPLVERMLEITVKSQGEQSEDASTCYNNLGLLYWQMGDYDKAEAVYQHAFAISLEVLGGKNLSAAAGYNNLGALYQAKGDYGKAAPFMLKALVIYQELHGEKHSDTASAYGNLGMLYRKTGDYPKSEQFMRKALDICQEVLGDKDPATAGALNNLGQLYEDMGDYGKAEPLMQKALSIQKEVLGENHPETALSYNNLGVLYKIIGDYGKAEQLLRKALSTQEKLLGDKHPETILSYNNLGGIYKATGDYDKAEQLMQKALSMQIESLGENHPESAVSYISLAGLYDFVGDYGKAEPLLLKALAIYQKVFGEKNTATATTYSNLGMLYLKIGDHGKAERLMEKSLTIYQEVLGEKHIATATSYNNLGRLYQDIGKYAEAEPMIRKSLEMYREILGAKHPDTIAVSNNLGFLYLNMGQIERAKEIFVDHNTSDGLGLCALALKQYAAARHQFKLCLSRADKTGEKEFIIGSRIGLGLASEGLRDWPDAEEQFKRAIDIMEAQRSGLGCNDRESFFSGKVGVGFDRLEVYESLIRVLMKGKPDGYESRALQYSERVKSRVFVEMLQTRGVRGKSESDRMALSKDREFKVKLTGLKKLLTNMRSLGSRAPLSRLEEARNELDAASSDYESFLKDVKLQNAELASLLTADVPEIGKLQALIDPDITLLEYFIGKEKTYAWVLTREQVKMCEIPVAEKKLVEIVNRVLCHSMNGKARGYILRGLVPVGPENEETEMDEVDKHRKNFMEATRELNDMLLGPLRGEIKTGKLIVVPHGVLHKVPFAALGDGTQFLVEQYDLTVLPSASVIPHIVGKRRTDKAELLALGNPATDAEPLPSAEKEVEMIGRNFANKHIYIRDKATKVLLESEAGKPSTIHLACHGWFNERLPLQSGLLLAGEGDDSGILQIHDVFGLDLRNTVLVVLSACETGLGVITSGDDMVGLSRAFVYAGTSSLVATLWKVEDDSTAILMESFYDNWRTKGMSKPHALRAAQLSIRAIPQYSHPYYWSGFQLFGDWK